MSPRGVSTVGPPRDTYNACIDGHSVARRLGPYDLPLSTALLVEIGVPIGLAGHVPSLNHDFKATTDRRHSAEMERRW
jgi:hypothetical protein